MFHNISDKLIAVNYPYSWDDSTTTADFRNLRDIVVFLEDTILRTLPTQSRAAIKNTSSSKKEFYQALHDYCDCSNNTNIIKLSGGGSAFMRSSSSSADQSSSSCVAGMNKLLSDLKDDANTGKSDLAAVVLIDRLLDLAIAQIVEDKSMNLEAAHAKWQDEQGKRNVTTLDLSNSLMTMINRSKKEEQETGKAKNKSSSSAVSKAIAEILACRNSSSSVKSSSSSSTLSQIGAAARFAVGLVDFDHHQNICAKVEEMQQQENNNNNNAKPIRGSPSSFSFRRLNLDDEWTKVALSEIPLFGEARVTYDQNTAPKKKLEKLSNNNISDHEHLLQNCARALRAIYTEDFSALQRRINVSLARLQELTATCATDPKLGRTGR